MASMCHRRRTATSRVPSRTDSSTPTRARAGPRRCANRPSRAARFRIATSSPTTRCIARRTRPSTATNRSPIKVRADAAACDSCEARRVITSLGIAGLTVQITGTQNAATTAVLLHGFGASGDDLVPLADELDAPMRFVFPAAPLELSGLYGDSRAWWLFDLEQLEEELRRGVPRDRSDEVPEGLPAARLQVTRLLDQLQARFSIPDERLVVGGFSQGAMLALDVALHRGKPP